MFAIVPRTLPLAGIVVITIIATSCGPQSASQSQLPSTPADVEVLNFSNEGIAIEELTQRKTFDQCDSASPLKAQIQFSYANNQERQQKFVVGASAGGEVGVSPVANFELQTQVEAHFAARGLEIRGHEEGVDIEVPARTRQEYVITWRENWATGSVEYSENGEVKSATYRYRMGLELDSAKGVDLECPGQEVAQQTASTATPVPIQPPTPRPPTPKPPTPTPTSDPRLFSDDFEEGIRPEWGISGTNYAGANGKLVVDNGSFETQVIGDPTWADYRIILSGVELVGDAKLRVMVRVQNRDNYVLFECSGGDYPSKHCSWYRVVNGQLQYIAGTEAITWGLGSHFENGGQIALEMEGNVYRTFINGDRLTYFTDDSFGSGGFKLYGEFYGGYGRPLKLGGIEVSALT